MHIRHWFAGGLLLSLSTIASAHGGEVHKGASPFALWHWSPEILIGLAVVALIYWRGSRHGLSDRRWRIAAFFGGLLALFVALISPVERLADHIFAVHQVEHMLLRTVAPMLIFLARPQAELVRGLPKGIAPFFAGSGPLRNMIDALRQPAVATALFLLASYFWMVPRWHDLAILNEPVHYVWHVSLLVTGLIFFSVIFDRRMPPQGPGLGTRLAMFVAAALGNILLGAFLTFKTVPLYSAYQQIGHLWHVSMLADEQTGGIIMWIPGTMMFAITAILVLYRFGKEETRQVERRIRTGRDLVTTKRSANLTLALGLAMFAMTMLAGALAVVSLVDHGERPSHAQAPTAIQPT